MKADVQWCLKLGVRYFNYLAVIYILIKIICLLNKRVICSGKSKSRIGIPGNCYFLYFRFFSGTFLGSISCRALDQERNS